MSNFFDNQLAGGPAEELATTGSPVNVGDAAPPTTGQVLRATSPTTAEWQTISTGGSGEGGLPPFTSIIEGDQFIDSGYIYEVQPGESDIVVTVNEPGPSDPKNFAIKVIGPSDTNTVAINFDGLDHEMPFSEQVGGSSVILRVSGTYIEYFLGDNNVWLIASFRWGRGVEPGIPRPDVAGALYVDGGDSHVRVEMSGAPETGYVLAANNATSAEWGGAGYLEADGGDTLINIIDSAPPTVGQVLTCTGSGTAEWQDPAGGGGGGSVERHEAVTSLQFEEIGDYSGEIPFSDLKYGGTASIFFSVGKFETKVSFNGGTTWHGNTFADSVPDNEVVAFASDGTIIVAVFLFGAIQTAPVPDDLFAATSLTWTSQTPADSFSGDWLGVVWTGSAFLTLGFLNEVQRSVDGMTWESVLSGFPSGGPSEPGSFEFSRIASSGGSTIIVGQGSGGPDNLQIWFTQDDGDTWTYGGGNTQVLLTSCQGGQLSSGAHGFIVTAEYTLLVATDADLTNWTDRYDYLGPDHETEITGGLVLIQDGVAMVTDGSVVEITADMESWKACPAGARFSEMQTQCGFTLLFDDDFVLWRTLPSVTVEGSGGGGGSDITTPGTTVDGNIVLWSGTDGDALQDSGISIADLTDGLVPDTRAFNTGVGLSGGGDLSADRTIAVNFGSSSTTVCVGNDARLSDDRRAASLKTATTTVVIGSATAPSAGMVLTATSSTAAQWQTPTGGPASELATTGAAVNVSSADPPTAGQVLQATSATTAEWIDPAGGGVSFGSPIGLSVGGSNSDGVATTVSRSDHVHSLPAFGTSSGTIAQGNDSRFPSAGEKSALTGTSGTPGSGNKYVTDADSRNTNARTPTSHASSHQDGGADELSIASLSGLAADPQKHEVAKAGSLISTRKRVNFIEGSNVTITVSDNSGSDRTDVTIAASGGGGSGDIEGVTAGTGLSGGGTSGTVTLDVVYGTTSGTATQGNDTRVVNAVQASRTISTSTGLTGGGDLSTNRTLSIDSTVVALVQTVSTQSSNFTAAVDNVYVVDTSGGAVTATLPAVVSSAGKTIVFKRVGANNLVLDGNASEQIDGATTLTLTLNYEWAKIVCVGGAWYQIS